MIPSPLDQQFIPGFSSHLPHILLWSWSKSMVVLTYYHWNLQEPLLFSHFLSTLLDMLIQPTYFICSKTKKFSIEYIEHVSFESLTHFHLTIYFSSSLFSNKRSTTLAYFFRLTQIYLSLPIRSITSKITNSVENFQYLYLLSSPNNILVNYIHI